MRTLLLASAVLSIGLAARAVRADVLEIRLDGAVATLASDNGAVTASDDWGDIDTSGPAEGAPDIPVAALTMVDAPSAPIIYQASLAQAAATAQVSPRLLAALVWQESRWHPLALSGKGARGLTQLMPATARSLAVDPADTNANLAGGARYLRNMLNRFDGNIERALAAYNAGPGRVERDGGLPKIGETRAYVAAIIDRLGMPRAIIGETKP